MRIEEIFIDGYGHLHDVRLNLSDGLVCIHGLNETGKSTVLAFIRSVFFGFSKALTQSTSRSGTPYDPVEGGEKGGHLLLVFPGDGAERRYRFERTKGAKADGELAIHDDSGKRTLSGEAAEELKKELLGGADATLFSNVFALGLSELHNLDSIGRPEVQGVLFTADAGLGSDLVREMSRLKGAMDELYVKRSRSKKIINALNSEIQDLDKQIRDAKSDLASYDPERRRHEELEKQRRELEEERSSLYQEKELAGQRTTTRPIVGRLKVIDDDLSPLKDEALPTAEDATLESGLKAKMDADVREITARRTRLEESTKKLDGLNFSVQDANLWPRVQAVQPGDLDDLLADIVDAQNLRRKIADVKAVYVSAAEENRYRKLKVDSERLGADRAKWNGQLKEAGERRETEESAILPSEIEATAQSLQRLDLAAHQVAEADANGRVRAEERNLARAVAELGPWWTEERLREVPTDVVSQANIASQLPGDIGRGAAPGAQYLPLLVVGLLLVAAGFVGLLGYFSAVASMLLAGSGLSLVGYSLVLRQSRKEAPLSLSKDVLAQIMAFGLQAPVSRSDFERVASAVRVTAEVARSLSAVRVDKAEAQKRLEDAHRRVVDLGVQVGLPTKSRDVMDILTDLGQLYERSTSARARLSQALQESNRIGQQVALIDQQLKEAQEGIDELLESKRCGGRGGEDQLEECIIASRRVDDWKRSLEGLSSQEARFGRILDTFGDIQRERGAEIPTPDSVPGLLADAAASCQEAHRVQAQAQSLRSQCEEMTLEIKMRDALLGETRQELVELYAKFACPGADVFREELARGNRRAELGTERSTLVAQLRELEVSYPSIKEDLASKTGSEDAQVLNTFEDRLADLKDGLVENEAEAKEIYARLRAWDSSDRLGNLLADLKALAEERDEAVAKWTELALSRFLLEETRSVYEVEHAPKVLKRAGEFVKTITNGRYEAIVRNAEGDGYELIMDSGKRLPATPPQLSRGVFAQVYLCIRLAYTDVMSSHRPIPYLLDDVLSDFDDERLERGLKVLSDLSKERQIVLLTHHGRVLDAAKKVGAASVLLKLPAT